MSTADDDERDKAEIERVRSRVHNLADKVQGHEIFIDRQRSEIDRSKQDIAAMRVEFMAQLSTLRADSSAQISTIRGDVAAQVATIRAEAATKIELAAFTELAKERMATLQKSIDQANNTLSKVAWIVISAVILAVLGLVIVNRGTIGEIGSLISPMIDVVAFGRRQEGL